MPAISCIEPQLNRAGPRPRISSIWLNDAARMRTNRPIKISPARASRTAAVHAPCKQYQGDPGEYCRPSQCRSTRPYCTLRRSSYQPFAFAWARPINVRSVCRSSNSLIASTHSRIQPIHSTDPQRDHARQQGHCRRVSARPGIGQSHADLDRHVGHRPSRHRASAARAERSRHGFNPPVVMIAASTSMLPVSRIDHRPAPPRRSAPRPSARRPPRAPGRRGSPAPAAARSDCPAGPALRCASALIRTATSRRASRDDQRRGDDDRERHQQAGREHRDEDQHAQVHDRRWPARCRRARRRRLALLAEPLRERLGHRGRASRPRRSPPWRSSRAARRRSGWRRSRRKRSR